MSGFEVLAEVQRHNEQARDDEAQRDHGGSPNSPGCSPLAPHTPLDTLAGTPGMRAATAAARR